MTESVCWAHARAYLHCDPLTSGEEAESAALEHTQETKQLKILAKDWRIIERFTKQLRLMLA